MFKQGTKNKKMEISSHARIHQKKSRMARRIAGQGILSGKHRHFIMTKKVNSSRGYSNRSEFASNGRVPQPSEPNLMELRREMIS